MSEQKKRYVLGLILDSSLKEVLLVSRVKKPYKGCINGVGGKIEEGESIEEAMLRELQEETDVRLKDIAKTKFMMTTYFPSGIELSVFYFVLNDGYEKKEIIETPEGPLMWYDFIQNDIYDTTRANTAGEGNVAYFVNYALCLEGVDTGEMRRK